MGSLGGSSSPWELLVEICILAGRSWRLLGGLLGAPWGLLGAPWSSLPLVGSLGGQRADLGYCPFGIKEIAHQDKPPARLNVAFRALRECQSAL